MHDNKTICLNMIVKNEAHVIASTLENLCHYIHFDYWVIVDTGSTDNTKQIIYDFFKDKNIKGELHETEWKNFGFNRSDALSKAFNKTDYLLIFDADDRIVGDFILPKELNLDGYHLKFGDNFSYVRLLLVNNALRWKFMGVLHEYIICTNEKYNCKFENIKGNYHLISGKSGARSNNPNKYRDDALILEKAYDEAVKLKDDIMVRYSFYCAQSYKDAGDNVKSIEWYKKRISHGGWNQEVYYSYITIGQLYSNMSNIESAFYYWVLSFDADPERCEGIYYIIKHCRENGKFQLAFHYYNLIEKNKTRNLLDKLFVTEDVYKYLLDYEFTIIACYVNQHKLATPSFHTLFKYANTLNVGLKEVIIYNLQFYLDFIDCIAENLSFFYDYLTFVKQIYLDTGSLKKHIVDATNILVEKFTPVLTYYNSRRILSLANSCKEVIDTVNELDVTMHHDVILTMTSCKRFDLFQKTVNSFINNCSDVNKITYFFCVDDNSSDEDREKMMKMYPFFDFYFKNPSEKGHRQSMNIIWNKLNELKPRFYLHLEDDWLFINKCNYISDSVYFLERYESDGIHQILFNKNYAEVINDFNLVGGKLVDEYNNIKLHIKDEPNLHGSNCAYWPHFSFRPSVIRTSAVLTLGNFNSPNTFFERDYADKYFDSGYTSAYFNEVNSIHIGKLTSETQNDKKNAYHLNSEEQFNLVNEGDNVMNVEEDFPCYLINLDKRQDRFDYCMDKMQIKFERYSAVDGNNLSSYSRFLFLLKQIDNKSIIRGEIGCKLSHYDIWQKIKKPTLIVEDDIMVHEETFTQLKSVFDNLNDLNATNSWDILYIAGQWTPRYDFNSKTYIDSHKLLDVQKNVVFKHITSTFYKRSYIVESFSNLFHTPLYRTTAGYIITPSGAKKLCSIINDSPEDFMNEPLDMWLLKLEKNNLITLLDSFPHPIFQGGFDLMKEECLLKTDIDRSKKTLFHLNHDDSGNENVLDNFEFIEGRDIIGNDLYYKKREHVIQLLNEALNNEDCVAVNTLGFYKKKIGQLIPSPYFSTNDGIYIKKNYYSAHLNNKQIIRVKFIGNFWDTSKKLIEEFKLMIPNNLDVFENIQITDEDSDIDYYVIINMPKDDSTYYDPNKTFVFSMEPDVMKETWGKWRHPNPNDFLYVHDKLNPVQWRFIYLSSFNDNDANKIYNKVACILSHKKYFIGQKKRIDFVNVLEKGECEHIIDVFGKENYHDFHSYKGVVPNDNTSNILTQYKYYFMCENSEQLDYATEKIWEPIICECLCFYWGCPNLSEYIDSRAYVKLDLNNMEQSKCIVKRAIEEDWWSQRLPFIRAEKQKILTKLGFFPTLKNIIESKRYRVTLQEFSHNSDSNNSNAVYYSQDKQDYFLENNVFKGYKSGIYVDVGAHDGVTINNTLYFHKNNKWNGINIEPMKSVYDKLLINRPNDKNINCAICNYDGKTEFICNNGYTEMISVIKETYDKRHYNRLDNENKLMNASSEIIMVDTKKLETIFDENNISHVHYLSIDVEGAEFEVIKSINFDKVFIDVIGFENNYNDTSVPIIEYLQSKKYFVINKSMDIFMIHERSIFYSNLNNVFHDSGDSGDSGDSSHNNTQKIHFITFGGPCENHHSAVDRVCSEAEQIKMFDKIIGYTEKNLINDTKFWNKHETFITENKRGYGYWLWKSYLTKKTMKEMNDNDILVYVDAGCTINLNGRKRLLEYFDIVNNSKFGILSFNLDFFEKKWCKMDIINYYDAHDLLETKQLLAGIFILKKCNHTINLIKEWYNGCCKYNLIDDSPSNSINDSSFIENRHDQSIFSILRKKIGSEVIDDETYFYPEWDIHGHNFPFWATRKL